MRALFTFRMPSTWRLIAFDRFVIKRDRYHNNDYLSYYELYTQQRRLWEFDALKYLWIRYKKIN